jgi:hypothetical protein
MGCFHDMFKIRSKHWIAFDGLGLQLGSKTDSGHASLETFAQVDGSTCKTLKLYQTDGVERRLTEGCRVGGCCLGEESSTGKNQS